MMYLGFDTSNYTTSVAAYDGEKIIQYKKLLEVKKGERGLRQSETLFQHTVNLPDLISRLEYSKIDAVGVSTRPRNIDGSYMPCFLAGINAASSAAYSADCPLYRTSHQVGHILAALYSVGRLDLINERFIAFHVSGGTTEALLITPDSEEIIKAELIAESTDLKAGKAIDRAGVMLGLDFPCGKELDALSLKSDRTFNITPSMNGLNCSLSGIENKAKQMFENNEKSEDIAKFVISSVCASIDKMTEKILSHYGALPLVYAGGVMSNTIIKQTITDKYGALFASPEYSCDNAAGIAIYAYLKHIK
jgi:N6-L-threonylcarbamoyladenine synthase